MVDLINCVIGSGCSSNALTSIRAYVTRYLPSSDWKIIFDIKEARKFAETNIGWVKKVFTQVVTVTRKGYTIIAYRLSSQRVYGVVIL